MACARLVGKDHFRHDESVDYNQKKMLKELCYIMTTHEGERERGEVINWTDQHEIEGVREQKQINAVFLSSIAKT